MRGDFLFSFLSFVNVVGCRVTQCEAELGSEDLVKSCLFFSC